jgi:hypothetical protein
MTRAQSYPIARAVFTAAAIAVAIWASIGQPQPIYPKKTAATLLRGAERRFARLLVYRHRQRQDAEFNEQSGASNNESKKKLIRGNGLDPHVRLASFCEVSLK